jgi:hypothetical protein
MTGQELQSWRYRGPDIPPSGGESTRINLWLLDGLAPSDGKEVEAIIDAFEFVPEH